MLKKLLQNQSNALDRIGSLVICRFTVCEKISVARKVSIIKSAKRIRCLVTFNET